MKETAYKAIKDAFRKEMDIGIIIWKPLDKNKPENARFINGFNLKYNSLVIAEERDGITERWKILEPAWDLIWKEKELIKYIQGEI